MKNLIVMKNLKFSTTIASLLMLASSCTSKQPEQLNEVYFTDNGIVYDETELVVSDTLRSEVIQKDRIGIWRLLVADSILCCQTIDLPHKFELYSIDGDSLAGIGLRGNGPNDFATGSLNGVIDNETGDLGVWVVDTNNAMLKRLNLSKSIDRGKSIVDSMYRIPGYTVDAFLVDGKLIYPQMVPGSFNLHIADGENGENVIYNEPLYLVDFGQSLMSAYHSFKKISPNGKYFVNPMLAINQVNILNLEDMSRLAVSIGNVKKQDEVLTDRGPAHYYYIGLTLSDDNIFALYHNISTDADMEAQEANFRQLHVFDYNGNLKGVYPFDKVIYDVSYSPVDNSLYAITADEEICRYRLPDFNK